MRPAFTLLEVLVALVLFEIGMLAIAATMAVTARELAAARWGTRAQTLVRERVERLRSGCPAPQAGTATALGVLTEHWRVEADGPLRAISDSISYPLPSGRRGHVVHQAWTLCG
jgi:Tfp pilus assembly protein PilV